MADVRIKDLPFNPTPNKNMLLATDLTSTQASTLEDLVLVGRPTASQAEAEAGTDATKAMTPLTVKQSIAANVTPSLVGAQFSAWINSLPTSISGLSAGDWWNNGGVPSQVQP